MSSKAPPAAELTTFREILKYPELMRILGELPFEALIMLREQVIPLFLEGAVRESGES